MKPIIFCMVLLSVCLGAQAQQPSISENPSVEPEIISDSLRVVEIMAEEPDIEDPVWEEATVDGLNFRIFGKYARDEDYYRQLVDRFERADPTLIGSDFFVLYYGFAYRDEYNGGYGGGMLWNAMIKENNYQEAYNVVTAALKTAPATPNYLADALQLAYALERPVEEISNLEWRLYTLLGWISVLGDGTEDYPWTVLNVSDEYTFMYNWLGVQQVKGQALIENKHGVLCDCMDIEPVENDLFTGSEVWFDVTFPLPMLESPHHWADKITKEAKKDRAEKTKKKKEKKTKKKKGEEN